MFSPAHGGVFMHRYGRRGKGAPFSQKKLCFVATDRLLLVKLLLELSQRDDCHYVKYGTRPRDGMYLGRCFMATDEAAGRLWIEYKVHPRLMCSIQDDDFTRQYR